VNDLIIIEIVKADIIDSAIKVGSGCEWKGKGKQPQWNNPKSTKAYDQPKAGAARSYYSSSWS